jgi:BlaI family penicillinase repressor
MTLPDLSRFELQVLRQLWELGEGTIHDLHQALPATPSYSTVRKIIERLEDKGAVVRADRKGRALVYKATVERPAMMKKEIRRFLNTLFNGSAPDLVAQLAEMDALSLTDLRELEETLSDREGETK